MAVEIIAKYIHFISIFAIVGALGSEHLLLKPVMTRAEIRRLSMIDGVYGAASILLLAAGFTLWVGVGKPASYYNENWIFLLKIGLFVVVGILSIRPTVYFFRQRKGDPDEEIAVAKDIVRWVRLELLIILTLPALATMMAKGLGMM